MAAKKPKKTVKKTGAITVRNTYVFKRITVSMLKKLEEGIETPLEDTERDRLFGKDTSLLETLETLMGLVAGLEGVKKESVAPVAEIAQGAGLSPADAALMEAFLGKMRAAAPTSAG